MGVGIKYGHGTLNLGPHVLTRSHGRVQYVLTHTSWYLQEAAASLLRLQYNEYKVSGDQVHCWVAEGQL